MISSPINNLYHSTHLYLTHQIEQKGRAYQNHSSLLYRQVDPELPNNTIYASPFKSWIFDKSISGATIPSGVYVNNVFCQKGVSGLKIDYLNGRAIFSGGTAFQNLTVSGSYAIKDFNVYPTTKSQEELVFETKYQVNPSYVKTLSGIDKNSLTVPGIFITNVNFTNELFEFGGLSETTCNFHCLVISDSKDKLDSVGGLLIDEKYSVFPIVTENYLPLNYYGDYKTGLSGYNYLSYVSQFPNSLGYICEVDFYKLTNKDFGNRYPDLKTAMVDVQVKLLRLPNRNIF